MQPKHEYIYAITETFGPTTPNWQEYKVWIQLKQLEEVVSLDPMLCPSLILDNSTDPEFWESVFTDGQLMTDLHRSLEYAIGHIGPEFKGLCNVICAIQNPIAACPQKIENDFILVGYDLLDRDYGASALSNCGGFYDIYSPSDVNRYGLITDFNLATRVQMELRTAYPEEHHADCHLWALYRQHNKAVSVEALNQSL
ncbi:MAG: hypothetical protein AAFX01_00335 [Cyanobacteria bacterium J06638_28]